MSLPKVNNVAVIGAGISGVCAAAHLLKQDLHVTLFERANVAGGVWHFDEATAADPSYPNETPSTGDYVRLSHDAHEYLTPPRTPDADRYPQDPSAAYQTGVKYGDEELSDRVVHAPPGACYAGLKNNVPLSLMKTSLTPWPTGLEEFVSQTYLDEYIQYIAESSGVNKHTEYATRVEDMVKVGSSWRVRTSTRQQHTQKLLLRTWQFDAVVVASGHYHMPRVPDLPGLRAWKQKYPHRISHSKRYRRSTEFQDQTVLLIGAGTSSTDIAKELAQVAKHVYQSSRGGQFDHPASVLPSNATRIGGIQAFELGEGDMTTPDDPIPGKVLLRNGQYLCNIDRVVLCTGYVTSYPFLSQFHNDDIDPDDADERVLVTGEGNMVHNLHKDIFYIEDPTLAFVGVPYHIATFSLFDFQSQLIARVFAGNAVMPSNVQMRYEYDERVHSKGRGRDFHSLRKFGAEPAYVESLVRWANASLADGVEPMLGHSEEWMTKYAAFREMIEKRIGLRLTESQSEPGKFDAVVLTDSNVC